VLTILPTVTSIPKVNKSGGRDKFGEPPGVGVTVPLPMPVWADALRQVDQDPKRRHPNNIGQGYVIPDPGMFTSTTRTEKYLINWLATRSAWLHKISMSYQGFMPIPAAKWRDWLNSSREVILSSSNVTSVVPSSSPASPDTTPTASQKRKDMAQQLFQLELANQKLPERVFWRETEISMGHIDTEPKITMEILWELYEIGFRFELLALDRTLVRFGWCRDDVALSRDQQIQEIFPGNGGYLVDGLPVKNEGLVADHWTDRAPFIQKLDVLLMPWLGWKEYKVKHVPGELSMTKREDVLALEKALARYYCQQFFDHFGRAAILPRRLHSPAEGSC